jgi:hypothetical protein
MKLVEGFNPKSILNKFKITKIETDLTRLNDNQKILINLFIKSAKIIDNIYSIQKHPDYFKLKEEINKSNNDYLKLYFKIMAGPLDQLNNNEPFIENITKTDKANFYPQDITKAEWNKYISKNPKARDELSSPYTMIIKKNDELIPVKYSDYFKTYFTKIIKLLKESLDYTENIYQKSYLESLIKAFNNNDFINADIHWMQVKNNDVFLMLGPYEFYDDKFLGYKASFTGLVGIKNKNEFAKLELIENNLNMLENHIPSEHHQIKKKTENYSKFEIIDVVFNCADSRYPIPAIAFNLPNSQNIRNEYGSKKILLYNIIEAKFNSIILPIAEKILDETKLEKITFNANFNLILMHELSHEFGLKLLKDTDGKMKDINYFLKNLYPIIEETKADVLGVYLLIFLIKEGLVSDSSLTQIYKTYFINLIRTLRYGFENAHAIASLIQLNYLTKEEVFILNNKNDLVIIDFHKFEKTTEALLMIILSLLSEGNYQKTDSFIKQYSKTTKEINKILDAINDIPIDILPWYPKAQERKPIAK